MTLRDERPLANPGRHRLGWGIVAPLVSLALIGLPILLAGPSLPEPMNISWGDGGEPKNPVSPNRFLGTQLTFWFLTTLGFVAGGFQWFRKARTAAMVIIVAVMIATTFAVISFSTVLLNRNLSDWTEAPAPGVVSVGLGIVLPLAAAALAAGSMRKILIPQPDFETVSPTAGLSVGDSESAAWHGACTARWPRLLGVIGIAVAIALMLIGPWLSGSAIAVGLVVLALALTALAFSRILVSIDRRGLTVRYGYLRWPSTHIALDGIESASVVRVDPMDYGGWGYRGSRKVLGVAAVVIRGGEGIHLQLRSGKQFIVTVDRAAQGAGVLNDLRVVGGSTG